MRLVILCEGETEEYVLESFLALFCPNFSKVVVRSHSGKDKLKAEFKIRAELELETDPNTYVLCLIDLHEAPFVYSQDIQDDPDPYLKQYAYIKKYMEDEISQPLQSRFHAFPVMHEIETWILADIEGLNSYLNTRLPKFTSPESIAQPVDILKKLVWQHRKEDYVKTRHGRRFFEHVSAQRVYDDSCPHFEDIINTLHEIQGLPPLKPKVVFSIPNEELYNQLVELEWKSNEIWKRAEKVGDLTPEMIDLLAQYEDQMKDVQRQIEEEHQS